MANTFSTALSGLRASSNALGVTGNNIANANTTAFKSGSISFADVFTSSLGAASPMQIGIGVRTAAITTQFSQGGLNDSASPTDAAIQGKGFFVVADSTGALAYTRAGEFSLDRSGFLVTPTGHKAQGYTAINGTVPPGAPLASIQVPIGEMVPPVTTTEATLRMNLNSTDPTGSQFHAPVRVFDSKGVPHTLDLLYTKQADGSYLMNATVGGSAAQTRVDGGAASSAPVAFTFDASGQLLTPTSLSIVPDQTQLSGAVLPEIAINLRQLNPGGAPGAPNITNFAAASAVASTDQDGFGAGSLAGVSLSPDRTGTLVAVFSNGQTRTLGQLAVAVFNSSEGLSHAGSNLYAETLASGQPSVGTAGSGGRGDVIGGALEQSNVDIATEFTDLIVAQRSFQANSRVITTVNQTLQDLLQII